MIEIGLKLISVHGEMDQYKINIRSLVSTSYITTKQTNIPAITVTVLAMALWSVIRILYLYACVSLTG